MFSILIFASAILILFIVSLFTQNSNIQDKLRAYSEVILGEFLPIVLAAVPWIALYFIIKWLFG